MDTLLVTPKDTQELKLITDLFSKMNVKTKVLSSDEKEDIILGEFMKEADRTKKTGKDSILKKLEK